MKAIERFESCFVTKEYTIDKYNTDFEQCELKTSEVNLFCTTWNFKIM